MTKEQLEQKLSSMPIPLVIRFALFCARDVEHLDPKDKETNDVTEAYINGKATFKELESADRASAASYAAYYAAAAVSCTSNASSYHAAFAPSNASYAASASAATSKSIEYYFNTFMATITELEKAVYGIY